ncbi:MAG: hypothetical protein UU23_C0001G0094 [Candidatus Curtissbacteria bacterium GW2011_GWA1_40_9]|uniref:Uncharacterized protein n=1 Tax=Candidatus Curtissbacteria bacterium GW2011_GWA1_40_9 TaxID=1618408 RepID=A0A0G0W212_9BACT|nr:MAG: hypothetical protein UU23_C0001G0094 [Candidatus Curtissbacteria bacterium GW2011_GWA1_40_9]
MSRQDTNLMEGEILTEETLDENSNKNNEFHNPNSFKPKFPKVNPKTLKNSLRSIKKTKFLTILLSFIVLITSFSALVILSSKKPQEQIVDPSILITSPKPTPKTNQELQQLLGDINKYTKKIEGLSTSIKNYPPPKVDLEIKF